MRVREQRRTQGKGRGNGQGNGRGHGRQGGRGHGATGGRRSLGRLFAHGDLRFLILRLVAEKPRHGYEIIKAIEESVAGAYSPSPGVIYPTLTLLEELGWVRVSDSDGSRKLYEATAEGEMALEANRTTVDAILARMADAVEAQEETRDASDRRADAPPIRRAFDQLEQALDRRLDGGTLAPAQVEVIVAALDAAANVVEGV